MNSLPQTVRARYSSCATWPRSRAFSTSMWLMTSRTPGSPSRLDRGQALLLRRHHAAQQHAAFLHLQVNLLRHARSAATKRALIKIHMR